jgi:Fic family protein
VFLGERDHDRDLLPEFIGANPGDLNDLMAGLIEANGRMTEEEGIYSVLRATAVAFGFVYVHPFQDGNGRLHRCLIHHVLAEGKFTPPGMGFPVSSVILDRIDDYRATLQGHSAPLIPFIEWQPTRERDVEVLNETADLYRYLDCTAEAEFLYGRVRHTVEEDLPREIDYLRRHDEAMRRIMNAVEMPDRLAENAIMFIRQNKGVLSKNRREGELSKLRDDEAAAMRASSRKRSRSSER